ncbi:MAG TPA: hypothetical protein VFN30_00430 [Chitinophagaceae bacterium]|nr:hypothetical protein [Chitinophagaceae bacterium]
MGSTIILTTGIISFLITILLPISPFAGLLGLNFAHFQQVVALLIILVAYVITADIV